jgi:hypothetical protein
MIGSLTPPLAIPDPNGEVESTLALEKRNRFGAVIIQQGLDRRHPFPDHQPLRLS